MSHSLQSPITIPFSDQARQWGELWGDRPRTWAGNEDQQRPTYEAALRALPVDPGDRVLDVGCGTGAFLRLAADAGAAVSGLDASEGLLAVARERVPEADLVHGDLQALPFEDDSFDVVTGFNAFFFAGDMVAALREARRVCRAGGTVLAQVFGRPEHCALEIVKGVISGFRGAAQEQTYWRPGMVEELAEQAGLEVDRSFDVAWSYTYAGERELTDAMMAAGGARIVAGPEREGAMRAAIAQALAPFWRADGSYVLPNEWHFVVARA